MPRLVLFISLITVPTLAGIGVIIMLALGYYDSRAILLSAAVGALGGFPVSWLVARRLQQADPGKGRD